MRLEEIPGRAFLDTSSLNFILEYGEYIFDGVAPPTTLSKRIINDIKAFYNVFLTGKRASWQLAISPFTYKEVIETQDATKKYYLEKSIIGRIFQFLKKMFLSLKILLKIFGC